MKKLILAAVTALALSTSAAAADDTGLPRQFNVDCKAQQTGGVPARQITAIDLDQGIGWHVERNVSTSGGTSKVFPVVVTKRQIDLRGDNQNEIWNRVKAVSFHSLEEGGMWEFREKGFGTFGVCKLAPYTPIPTDQVR